MHQRPHCHTYAKSISRSYVGDAVLRYVFNNPNTHTNVTRANASLIARIVKVYWSTDIQLREVKESVLSFFNDQTFHIIAGLNIVTEIVEQMNQFIPGIPFSRSIISLALETKSAHRISAAHFRDINNLPLFETALTYLPTVNSPDGLHLSVDQVYITEAALRLINAILSFDYLGSQTDGNDEEVSLIHLPSCWSSVICDSSLPELFGLL